MSEVYTIRSMISDHQEAVQMGIRVHQGSRVMMKCGGRQRNQLMILTSRRTRVMFRMMRYSIKVMGIRVSWSAILAHGLWNVGWCGN